MLRVHSDDSKKVFSQFLPYIPQVFFIFISTCGNIVCFENISDFIKTFQLFFSLYCMVVICQCLFELTQHCCWRVLLFHFTFFLFVSNDNSSPRNSYYQKIRSSKSTVVLSRLINLSNINQSVNPLSSNPAKWSNTLEQFVGKS